MVLQHGVHGGDGGIGGILCGEGTSGEFNASWGWLASVGRDEVGWGGGGSWPVGSWWVYFWVGLRWGGAWVPGFVGQVGLRGPWVLDWSWSNAELVSW